MASSMPSMPLLKSIKFKAAAGKPVAGFLTAFCEPSAGFTTQNASHPTASAPPVSPATVAAADLEPPQETSRPIIEELILEDITFKLCKQAPKSIEATLQSLDLSCLSHLTSKTSLQMTGPQSYLL
jgi:hypothetical protein